jgi:hypothetical protein
MTARSMPHVILGVHISPEYVDPFEAIVIALRERHPGKTDYELASLVMQRGIVSLRMEIARERAARQVTR